MPPSHNLLFFMKIAYVKLTADDCLTIVNLEDDDYRFCGWKKERNETTAK